MGLENSFCSSTSPFYWYPHLGWQKPFVLRQKRNRGGWVIRSGLALSGQSLKNSPEVANAPASDRLRIWTEIKDLHRDVAFVAILD